VPYYGYIGSPPAIEQYYKDLEEKVQSWFGKVRDMARDEGISELKSEKNWIKEILNGKCSKWCSATCLLPCLTC
jgi:hypothetical protein